LTALTSELQTVTYYFITTFAYQQKHILARPACGGRGGRGRDYELCIPVAKLSFDFALRRKLNPF